jgi:hypothetical protein
MKFLVTIKLYIRWNIPPEKGLLSRLKIKAKSLKIGLNFTQFSFKEIDLPP